MNLMETTIDIMQHFAKKFTYTYYNRLSHRRQAKFTPFLG